ncbi:hypothetical protein TeGR_g1613 [Tetraparma gracilis]|uniref:Uncharacterized protein n=1 Tax=Tetraparma gracilis TaxID=2962635 RepID=A0ABQ6NAM2_9STRA|nr:hypothetical protein TeGR_g1613 [Tetraparma gracilis]
MSSSPPTPTNLTPANATLPHNYHFKPNAPGGSPSTKASASPAAKNRVSFTAGGANDSAGGEDGTRAASPAAAAAPATTGIHPKLTAAAHSKAASFNTAQRTTISHRRFSLNSNISTSPSFHMGLDAEGKDLTDLTVHELLDVLKNLSVPLKARKCLDHVGVSGKDFSYYNRRDLEQIGIKSPPVIESTLKAKDSIILENAGHLPKWLLDPMGKRDIMKRNKQINVSNVGFEGWNWGGEEEPVSRGGRNSEGKHGLLPANITQKKDGRWESQDTRAQTVSLNLKAVNDDGTEVDQETKKKNMEEVKEMFRRTQS